MKINVLKFGGTSMNDHSTWKKVLEIIKKYEYPVVVVSATARTTRKLIEAAKLAEKGDLEGAKKISEEIQSRHNEIVHTFLAENPHPKNQLIQESCDAKTNQIIGKLIKLLEYIVQKKEVSAAMQDAVASIGEQLSSYLLAQCGLALDMLTQHVEARKIIKTDNEYGKANPNKMLINQKCGSLETMMDGGFTPIIGGFYGEAPDKTITTLGFEGSDYSASLIGAALHADSIEIWTDVSGVFSSDPRFIKNAKPLSELSYYDATEMAYFGAKVLHPSTLKPAQERNIPVLVKNMFDPEALGTKIVRDSKSQAKVLALSFKENIALLTISAYETLMGFNFLTAVFKILSDQRIPVHAVNTTEASVTIAMSDFEKLDEISNLFFDIGTVDISRNNGIITLIGCQFDDINEISELVFKSLLETDVTMISFTKSKRLLNLVVDEKLLIESTQAIHDRLF